MADHRTHRKPVDAEMAGAEPFGITKHDEPFTGQSGTLQERVARAGHPLQSLLITALVGVTAAGLYPSDGAGIALGGAADPYIDLAADAPAHALAGLGIAIWDDTPSTGWLPELWRIASYNTTTKRAYLAGRAQVAAVPAIPWHVPRVGSKYALGVVTYQREWLRISPEYEVGTGAPAVVIPHYSDLGAEPPISGPDAGQLGVYGPVRELRWAAGARLILDNHGTTLLVRQPGYFKGRTRSDECLGGILAKVELVTIPASGRVALCAGAT